MYMTTDQGVLVVNARGMICVKARAFRILVNRLLDDLELV